MNKEYNLFSNQGERATKVPHAAIEESGGLDTEDDEEYVREQEEKYDSDFELLKGPHYYHCSSCPRFAGGFVIVRQADFIRHLRDVHAPFAIKKGIAKADSRLQLEWEAHIKEMVVSCLRAGKQM